VNLNPPRRIRAALYLLATFGAPVTLWASAEEWLDAPTETLCGAVLALIMGLAVANTATSPAPARRRVERGAVDVVTVLAVLVIVVLLLILLGYCHHR
jgi:hypothetical protein